MKTYSDIFERIIAPDNLFDAWESFRSGKRNKQDVLRFERTLEENIFALHRELTSGVYQHGPYEGFYVRDPKQRHIHKAMVRDRVLHHAIFSVVNPIFEETFIPDSFSCRVGYGTHRGVDALAKMAGRIVQNGTRPCFALKCDVRRFFDSVDHRILLSILKRRIRDDRAIDLLRTVIESYAAGGALGDDEAGPRKGIPIGNLTSQLFANVYMNEFDQFVKHGLKVRNYVRYTDDFVVVGDDLEKLEALLPEFRAFLRRSLALELHPQKITFCKFHQGLDFLGYILFPKYRLVRRKTVRRMLKILETKTQMIKKGGLSKESVEGSLRSYLGVLSHANCYKIRQAILNRFWF